MLVELPLSRLNPALIKLSNMHVGRLHTPHSIPAVWTLTCVYVELGPWNPMNEQKSGMLY